MGDKMMKYMAVVMKSNGKWEIGYQEDTLSEAKLDIVNILTDGNISSNPDIVDILTDSNTPIYPYRFIVKIPEGHAIDLYKDKIVYATAPFKFMKGWTMDRAIKRIVFENNKK